MVLNESQRPVNLFFFVLFCFVFFHFSCSVVLFDFSSTQTSDLT